MTAPEIPTILLCSNESWGEVWFSKHHYANEMARTHKVYFINPPGKWKLMNLFSFSVRKQRVTENLATLDYANNFPVRIFPFLFRFINDKLNCFKIQNILSKEESKSLIFWQFDPLRFIHIYFPNTFRIYHVVDPYENIFTDKKVALQADLILSVTPQYMERYKAFNINTLLIPHGIGKDELVPDKEEMKSIQNKFGKYLLLTGTFGNGIDFELLAEIAKRFPSIRLLLIGPVGKLTKENQLLFEKILKFDNLTHLSGIHAKHLKNYIGASEACLTAYKAESQDGLVKRTPLKFSNYIAQKKAIISSYFPDFEAVNGKVLHMATTHTQFIELIAKALKHELPFDEQVTELFIQERMYDKLLNTIFLRVGEIEAIAENKK